MPETQLPAKVENPGKETRFRRRLHKVAAALTHALFVLTVALIFVRNGTPNAAVTGADATEGAARKSSAGQDRLPTADDRLPVTPAEAQPPRDPPASIEAQRDAAADPQAALPDEHTAATPDTGGAAANTNAGELVLARNSRRNRERPEPAAAAPRPATEEEKTRFKPLLDRLVAAYPDFLVGHDETHLVWKDGTRMAFDDGKQKTLEDRLVDADLDDQMLLTYTPGPALDDPLVDFDPGRIRDEAFFKKMYGDCKKGEVQKRLVSIDWLPKHGGKPIKATPVNGVAEKLQLVSQELDALGPDFMKYLLPISGTFNCRNISRTDRSSAHGFGIAIDINAKFGDYWQWRQQKGAEALSYRNQIPWEIVAIFEKHGFIWGGKWYHFDTAHFEYRPEMIVAADTASSQTTETVPMPEKQPRNLN